MIYTPTLPEIVEAVYEKSGLIEGEDEDIDLVIADKASGLYFAAFSLGTIASPTVGSLVYEMVKEDWAYTCDIFAVIAGIYTVIYLVLNVLPDLKKERENKEKMEEKILESKIIQKKIGIEEVTDDNEDTSAHENTVEVPKNIWERKKSQVGTKDHTGGN